MQVKKVIFNQNLGDIMKSFTHKSKQIFALLKSHHRTRSTNNKNLGSMLWFINPQKEMLNIEYLSTEQLQKIIVNVNANDGRQLIFDPLYCIFGTLINSNRSLKYNLQSVSTTNTLFLDSKQLQYSNKQKQVVNKQTFQIPLRSIIHDYPATPIAKYQNQSHHENLQTFNKHQIYQTPKTKHTQQSQINMSNLEIPNLSQFKFTTPAKKSNLTYGSNDYLREINKGSITQRPTLTLPTKQHSPLISYKNFVKQSLATDRTFMTNIVTTAFKLETPQTSEKTKNEWGSNILISPSQKIKCIAMNGRQGLDVFKNVKLLTPAYHPSKYEYLA